MRSNYIRIIKNIQYRQAQMFVPALQKEITAENSPDVLEMEGNYGCQ